MTKPSYPNTPLGSARSHKDKQNGRLSGTGHRMVWRRHGKAAYAGYLGTCRLCDGQVECDQYGPHFWGGNGAPSLLKFSGVNIIRRCPGGR
jgi:hypothetical protein